MNRRYNICTIMRTLTFEYGSSTKGCFRGETSEYGSVKSSNFVACQGNLPVENFKGMYTIALSDRVILIMRLRAMLPLAIVHRSREAPKRMVVVNRSIFSTEEAV
jgi:hypothetical protein